MKRTRRFMLQSLVCLGGATLVSLFASVSEGQVPSNFSGVRIEYSYDGDLGIHGVATGASAYRGTSTQLIASAKVIGFSTEGEQARLLEVEETHFSSSGSVTYRGKIFFEIGFISRVEKEVSLSGRKTMSIFQRWPMGH